MRLASRNRSIIAASHASVEVLEGRRLLAITTPSFASNYVQTFAQDFTTMGSLSANANGPLGPGGATWMSHKPKGGDWFTFKDPGGNLNPFAVDSTNGLTIRVQKNGPANNGFNGYTGGLLSSMDHDGNGFSQQYGYFEASMKLPGSPNTWPAFWLMSRNGALDQNINEAEVDVMESYGNWNSGPNNTPAGDPNHYNATWHKWNADNSHEGNEHTIDVPGATTGYHTYGVDIEPSGMTFYLDRQVVWTAPIYEAAKHPMYVMVNLALGGGSYNNANGTGYNWDLTPNPTDLKVQYISVWASPSSPNFSGSLSANATGATIGTTGSYSTGASGVYTASDGANAVFDGNVNTYFDGPSANGVWAGKDLGSAKQITELTFAPRAGNGTRMVGGKFQVSNSANFSSGVLDLYVVKVAPANGLQTLTVNSGTAYRYVRYVGPDGSFGNIAEMSVKALNTPGVPANPSATAISGTQVNLAWTSVNGASGYNIYRSTTSNGQGATPLAANVETPYYADQSVTSGTTYYYKVTAVNPSGQSGNSAQVSVTPTGAGVADLTGSTIGTTGSWSTGNSGLYTASDGANTLFDGNLNTFFDAAAYTNGNGVWVGRDLGSSKVVTEIRYAPRGNGFGDRMAGGKFQASNTADFSSGVVDLYTISGTPPFSLTTVSVNPSATAYRYVRYLSPTGGWGNASEIVFRGVVGGASTPAIPTGLSATPISTTQINLAWTDVANNETGYLIERKTGAGGAWSQIASVAANSTSYPSTGLTGGTQYYYRVRATNGAGNSAYSNEANATTQSAAATTLIASNVVSTGSQQNVPGTTLSLGTNLPASTWIWGAGWNWSTPKISATWEAPSTPSNVITFGEEKTALGLSIASAGSYTKPTSFTVSAKLYALGTTYSNKIGLGFWSAMPARSDSATSLTNFTGVVLDQNAGTLQTYANGAAAAGSAVSVGTTISSGTGYTVTYTVNTSTGAISNISFNGAGVSGLSTSGFSNAATAYAGVMDFVASRAAFSNFTLAQPAGGRAFAPLSTPSPFTTRPIAREDDDSLFSEQSVKSVLS